MIAGEKMIIPDDVKITPWLEQYRKFKAEYPDAILFFRMGDFYEMFFEDARIAAAVLEIALTARDSEKKIPMAGIPHHALNQYLGRLLKAGYRVAICEQLEQTGDSKIVKRKIVRIVTPGTYVPEENDDNSGHLAAILPLKNHVAVALLSVDTGRLEAGTVSEREAAALIAAFSPGEILVSASVRKFPEFLSENNYALREVSSENFKIQNAASKLKRALNARNLESFGISENDACVGCAWAVLEYLSATQFSSLNNVLKIAPLKSTECMILDTSAQKNLEIIPEAKISSDSISLFESLDKCRTPMGRRTLRNWLLRPLIDVKAIKRRQDSIKILFDEREKCSELADLLAGTRDVERALSRLALGTGNPSDLGVIRDTLRIIPDLKSLAFHDSRDTISEILRTLPDLSDLSEYLGRALRDNLPKILGTGELIREGFNSELDNWRNFALKGSAWLENYLEKMRASSETPKLKVGYNRAFGYYLEIGKTGLVKTPQNFQQRQTLVNAKRYVTPELQNFQLKMENSESEISRIEKDLYQEILSRVIQDSTNLQLTGKLLGILDCACSAAIIARERNYVCPEIDNSEVIAIKSARHPVIEAEMRDSVFVPNDAKLDEKSRVIILTGPNMAGKSTWLRMTALIAIMSQAGLWVPAESARIGIIDRIFTRIGARDDLVHGNSTFMIEMLETANILNNATDRSLIILDEVGRGTATWDGMSIAWAVLEYLQANSKARVLFATHYHELTRLEKNLDGVKNFSMAVSEAKDGILFLHQVVAGAADRSYGIEVARLAGLPNPVLKRAFELLEIFERDGLQKIPLSEPLPQNALRRQISLFSPEADGIIEEISNLDLDNTTPMQALKILGKFKSKSQEILH